MQTGNLQLILDHELPDTTDEWSRPVYRRQEIPVTQDPHAIQNVADQSQVYFTGYDCEKFQIQCNTASLLSGDSIEIIYIWVPPFNGTIPRIPEARGQCTSPASIPQSVWRSGLPAPKPGRTATPTHHCIVHHSADGNGNTNYTDLVRTYYTYHTQVNGWDDIGYNYLIAANGDVYAGRDPEKPGIRQDNVLGAHFCGKNNNTMGICMIGNLSAASPTPAAIESLTQLLGWKIRLDSLNPTGFYRHPDAAGALLPVIAGHRDGCSTECPGNLMYAKLEEIRLAVTGCAVAEKPKPMFAYSYGGKLYILHAKQGCEIRIYTMDGRLVKRIQNAWEQEEIADLAPGKCYLVCETINGRRLQTLKVLHME